MAQRSRICVSRGRSVDIAPQRKSGVLICRVCERGTAVTAEGPYTQRVGLVVFVVGAVMAAAVLSWWLWVRLRPSRPGGGRRY